MSNVKTGSPSSYGFRAPKLRNKTGDTDYYKGQVEKTQVLRQKSAKVDKRAVSPERRAEIERRLIAGEPESVVMLETGIRQATLDKIMGDLMLNGKLCK